MASIWNRLRGKTEQTEERLTVSEWAQMFNFQGQQYPFGYGAPIHGNKAESIDNDYLGYVNGAYKGNGIIFACCEARRSVFTEARFIMRRHSEESQPGDLIRHPSLRLLENPWPNGNTGDLLARAIQDVDMAGNHYMVTEGVGRDKRLRRLRPDWVDIILTAPPEEAVESDVAGYLYRPGGTDDRAKWIVYPIDGSNGVVAHWAPIPDPAAQYRGMSWLQPILSELMADKAATTHKLKFFQNAATPNLSVSFDPSVTPDQAKAFAQNMNERKHGLEHAYETLYLGGGADVKVLGADLKQLDFKVTQAHGETRIAAAARVPAVIAGISEGLGGSSLNEGNFRAAKDAFGDSTMRPLWRSLCSAYTRLIEDLAPDGMELWYDDRDIAFLRQDREEVAEIQAKQAQAMGYLVMQGFTPESIVEALMKENWNALDHTGLYSVQLIPPGADAPSGTGQAKHNDPDQKKGDGTAKPASGKDDKPATTKQEKK
ncbi:phage portal protein [Rhodococcus sp. 11-3]|uniref:phage portal protein n=1 Tax=Rhodococcus sp. 11-3 TaxID=2854796 RepID=UPI00203F4905|nr:phage portal protein [Rhodococcus sp. 11-3]USC17032.1 phage portal protein [Rhodococcus sp. 11-3]